MRIRLQTAPPRCFNYSEPSAANAPSRITFFKATFTFHSLLGAIHGMFQHMVSHAFFVMHM